MMLLRTLVPAEGESPLSFLVRLADVNRVSSPIDVLRQCQNYPRNIILPALIDAHSLARANGISPIEFGDPFGVFRIVKGGEGNRSELLCGLPVSRGTLRGIKDASFCVQCVTENKTIHAVWHISNYSCCHKHGEAGKVVCSSCSSPASWDRPGLLKCRCGGDLVAFKSRHISESEMSICALISRSFCPSLIDPKECKLPWYKLKHISVSDLLVTIRFFASHTTSVRRTSRGKVQREVSDNTAAAAAVFENWPHGFRSALMKIEELRGKPINKSSGRQNWIYTLLGKERIERKELGFIKSEIDRHIALNEKINFRVYEGEKYFNADEVAEELGLDYRTILKACKSEKIPCIRATRRGVDGLMIDVKSLPSNMLIAGKPMRIRKAAHVLGIPVRLLRRAEQSGLFMKTVRAYYFAGSGWSKEDVGKIRLILDAELTCRPTLAKEKGVRLIPLRHVLRQSYLLLDYRYYLLEQFLSSDIAVARRGSGFNGVLVSEHLGALATQQAWSQARSSA